MHDLITIDSETPGGTPVFNGTRVNHRQINLKTILSILSVAFLSTAAYARIHVSWSYDRLTKEADLIVIATPVSVVDTIDFINPATFPNIVSVDTNNVRSPIPAIGVETTFTVLSILKGDAFTRNFVLYHLREAERKLSYWGLSYGGPRPVAFEPKEKKIFLLFLKRESNGRYAPLTGHTDPVDAVKDLGAYP